MAPCVASAAWHQEIGSSVRLALGNSTASGPRNKLGASDGRQSVPRQQVLFRKKDTSDVTNRFSPFRTMCLLCSQSSWSKAAQSQRSLKVLSALNALPEFGASRPVPGPHGQWGIKRGVQTRAWLDCVAAPPENARQGRRKETLLEGSIDPQRNWQGGEDDEGVLQQQGGQSGEELSAEELWSSVEAEPGFSMEMLGGQRIVELVSAWDKLAPQLPPDVGKGAAAQVLLGALKLAVPALQGPCPSEGGRPRLLRALEIAKTLANLKMDAATLAAGVLVEAVEAGTLSLAAVEAELGSAVGRLVHDSGRVRAVPSRVDTYDDDTARALRQFCLAFHDVRAIVVELAAQLETMRHVSWLPRYQQQLVALETLQIYAPMAHALGTGTLMWELEDAAFRVLYPSAYASCEAFLRSHWQASPAVLENAATDLDAALRSDARMCELARDWALSSRTKSLYSFMRKQIRDGRQHSEVYDLLGLRMIVKPQLGGGTAAEEARGAEACYRVREVALQLWTEHSERYKDYIRKPKKNGYQSLHMLVQPVGHHGTPPVELQIRSERMDAAAVSGAAAHGAYKGGLTDPQQVEQLRLIMEAAAKMATASFQGASAGSPQVSDDEDAVDHIFAMLDKNGDGQLSVDELAAAMMELGAGGAGDATELMTLLDCNTDGSVSLAEFALFRRRVAVLRDLPTRDAAIHQQLHATWADAPGEVAEATFRSLGEEDEAGSHQREGPAETRGLSIYGAEGADGAAMTRGNAQASQRSLSGASVAAEGSMGLGAPRELSGHLAVAARSIVGEESGRRAALEGSRRSALPRRMAQSGTIGSLGASAGRGASAGVRVLASGAVGAGGSGVRRAAVGGSGGSTERAGVAAVVARGGTAEDLVEELRVRGGRAHEHAVADETEFLVEKGSDLDRKLSHYTASSDPTSTATGHSAVGTNGSRSRGGTNGGGEHVISRQELNRRLAGLPYEAPAERGMGPTEDGGDEGVPLEEQQEGVARALQRVEAKVEEGKYDEARTLLNVLAERHSANGRLWLLFGRLERQDPLGVGAAEVYARAQGCLERQLVEVEQQGGSVEEERHQIGADLAEVGTALASLQTVDASTQADDQMEAGPSEPVVGERATSGPRRRARGVTPLHRAVLGRGGERGGAPRSGAQLHQLALRFQMQGNVVRARTLLLQGLQAAPRDCVLRLTLARLEAEAGNIVAARDHFQLAATAAPHNVLTWQSWGVFEAKQGDFVAARRLFSRGLALDPRNSRLLSTWARQEARRGCPEGKAKAVELYQRCLEVDSNDVGAWQAWGMLEGETGNVYGARRLFEACLQHAPQEPAPLVAYAKMERLYGSLEAGRSLLKRATYIDPRYQPALLEWSLLEQQAGHPAAAADLLERAKALPVPRTTPRISSRARPTTGLNGKDRHKKAGSLKAAELRPGSSAALLSEDQRKVSFKASVQALTNSYKATSSS